MALFISSIAWSQTEFFNSKINFSENELNGFYSSISVDSTRIYFNANDYTVYAYDKKSGELNWSYYLSYKTNNPPIPYRNSLFVGKHSSQYHDECVQLNSQTGDTIQTLTIQSIDTKPVFRDNIMYCTAIDAGFGGAVMAYDLKKNSVIWEKFIAHGVSKQPYYLQDKIIANAEDDNWFELDYNGKLLDTTCKNKVDIFVEDIKCVRNFKYLIHNQKEVHGNYFDEDEKVKLKYTKDKTIVLGENKMLVINNRNKTEKEIKLDEVLSLPEDQLGIYIEIFKAEENTVWFFYRNNLVNYDFKNDKLLRKVDLSSWNPHQIILENRTIWLISKNDGKLYGLDFEPDKKTADTIEAKARMEREINNPKPADPKKIEAAKAAQEKMKNKAN
ncbi:outer membrane protein assembly factor BamB family protein [Flavobacterium fluvii]|nr:PQQ-binding-like beta-propeller repeat protein [Flavobacterium fluvii]